MTVDLEANADTISTTMYPDGLGGKTVKTESNTIPHKKTLGRTFSYGVLCLRRKCEKNVKLDRI